MKPYGFIGQTQHLTHLLVGFFHGWASARKAVMGRSEAHGGCSERPVPRPPVVRAAVRAEGRRNLDGEDDDLRWILISP